MHRIRPFSCGTQWVDWQEANCAKCTKGGTDGVGIGCEISDALSHACIADGTVSKDIARRMGRARFPDTYGTPCSEFRHVETGRPWKEWTEED